MELRDMTKDELLALADDVQALEGATAEAASDVIRQMAEQQAAHVDAVNTSAGHVEKSAEFEHVRREALADELLRDLAEQDAPKPERTQCEDCEGSGHTDDYWPASDFQPAEPVLCSSCNGSGWAWDSPQAAPAQPQPPKREPLTEEQAAEILGFERGVHFDAPGLRIEGFSSYNKERITCVQAGWAAAHGITQQGADDDAR